MRTKFLPWQRRTRTSANVAAGATTFNCPNYVGELFLVGANQTPFLSMIGGLSGGLQARSWQFPTALEQALEAAAQPAITENASKTAPTAETYVPTQATNVCQIFQKSVDVTYARMSDQTTLTGLALANGTVMQPDPVTRQRMLALQQIAVDVEYTFINGVYQLAATADQANKTRGILAAVTTNAVAAAGAAFEKALLDQLLRSMADNGAPFTNMVCMANSWLINQISNEYGYAEQSNSVGGVAVKTILTDFCTLSVIFNPKVPAGTLLVTDVSVCAPVFLPVPGKGFMFYEPLATVGAAEKGQIYGQCGLAYGPERYHGKITGLATS